MSFDFAGPPPQAFRVAASGLVRKAVLARPCWNRRMPPLPHGRQRLAQQRHEPFGGRLSVRELRAVFARHDVQNPGARDARGEAAPDEALLIFGQRRTCIHVESQRHARADLVDVLTPRSAAARRREDQLVATNTHAPAQVNETGIAVRCHGMTGRSQSGNDVGWPEGSADSREPAPDGVTPATARSLFNSHNPRFKKSLPGLDGSASYALA